MAFKFKNKEGQDATADIDEKLGQAIADIAAGSIASATAELDGRVTTAVATAIKPITEQLGKLGQAGQGGDEPALKSKAKGGDDEAPAWAKGLIDTVGKLSSEREAERQDVATAQRVEAYLAKNHPNADKGRLAFLRKRAIAAAPKDDAALKAAIDEAKQEMTEMGVDVAKALSANPAAEGAKPSDADADAAARAKEQKLKDIATHKSEFQPTGTR